MGWWRWWVDEDDENNEGDWQVQQRAILLQQLILCKLEVRMMAVLQVDVQKGISEILWNTWLLDTEEEKSSCVSAAFIIQEEQEQE